ncbi:hypothetical protein K440DRAFT_660440 [Wilcoxina mikolae CBS 423.85]|nr:hypothetical protein K440DRAFT_660440 [Wilcoxina mikolae CBS 423.85]
MSTNNIYTGLWTNHSRGAIFGSTLTLTDAQATALVSFLAVLITHTSTRSFKILRYISYHLRSHELARDGLARQQDVLLRNAETDMAMLPVVPWIAWKWRGHTRNPFRRSTGLFVITLLHAVGFIAAGIATSFVAAGNDQPVIARGSECGYWTMAEKTVAPMSRWQSDRLKMGTATRAYARLCYDGGEERRSECRVFPRTRLTWKETNNATCPFGDGICLEGETAAYTMDTGLQSSEELGINSPHTLQWQHRMTCAPLKTEGYTVYRIGGGNFGENVTDYMYGPVGLEGNSSYSISDWEKLTANGIIFNTQTSTPWIGNGTFQLDPIPALKRDDADVTLLFFAAYGINYYEPIDDPLFSAHQQQAPFLMPGYAPLPIYKSDHPVTVMGCAEQSRLCNPRNHFCTPFVATHDPSASFYSPSLAPTKAELDVAMLLDFSLDTMSIYVQSIGQGATVLEISDHIYAGSALNISREQWKKEASHLFELGLAAAQVEIVQMAKDSYPQDRSMMVNMIPQEFRDTCRMIIFREAGFTSISVFGVCVILISTVVITTVSLLDEAVGAWVARKWPHRALAWGRMDGVFWLLRMVNEKERIGSWTGGEVPVTVGMGEKLGVGEVVEGRVGVVRTPTGGWEAGKIEGGEFGPEEEGGKEERGKLRDDTLKRTPGEAGIIGLNSQRHSGRVLYFYVIRD